jgi:hypothetical protein
LSRIDGWLGGTSSLAPPQPSVQHLFQALDQCLTDWAAAESCLMKFHARDLIFASIRQHAEPFGSTPLGDSTEPGRAMQGPQRPPHERPRWISPLPPRSYPREPGSVRRTPAPASSARIPWRQSGNEPAKGGLRSGDGHSGSGHSQLRACPLPWRLHPRGQALQSSGMIRHQAIAPHGQSILDGVASQ